MLQQEERGRDRQGGTGREGEGEETQGYSSTTEVTKEGRAPDARSGHDTQQMKFRVGGCEDLPLPLAHVGDKKVKRFHFSEIIGRLPYMRATVTIPPLLGGASWQLGYGETPRAKPWHGELSPSPRTRLALCVTTTKDIGTLRDKTKFSENQQACIS